MLSNIGIPGLILIVIFALIVFGPKKLPELGKSMGKTLKEFKSATREITGDGETTQEMMERTVAQAAPGAAEHAHPVSETVTHKA